MNILVACEESQAVCKAFRAKGHNAFSCDLEPCSGGHPEWHIQADIIPLLNGKTLIFTSDGTNHGYISKWDMIIAFPPCTHLAAAGAKYFEKKRQDGRQQSAIDFFMTFVNTDCPKIAIENPVGVMSTIFRKPDQIIHPFQFGHPYTKKTCLWLKGLPLLKSTQILSKPPEGWENQYFTPDGRYGGFKTVDATGKILRYSDPMTAKIRSKTFPGIAQAMADQWG